MPDVRTDTFGPGGGPTLASLAAAGWRFDPPDASGRRQVHRPPGETTYRDIVDEWNSLVAAVGVMDDLEMKQAESRAGVTVDSLPVSIFPGTATSRWTGGFAYAPENQFQGLINDPCGQNVDFVPGYGPPVGLAATPSITGGTLAAATYSYQITTVTATGESTPSAAVSAVVASGTTGSVALTWTAAPAWQAVTGYRVYGRTGASHLLMATVTTPAYTDTGAATPAGAPPATDTSGGGTPQSNLPVVQYVPFLIQVEDFCSTFGWEARDFTGRALRLLDNATPNAIEREFWSGAFAQNALTGPMAGCNPFLTQSVTAANGGTGVGATDLTPATPPSITRGIQILEDYLANSGFGGQGMLHVTPQTTPTLLGAHRVGALLLSVLDNIIVPGSGYPNTGATGPIGNANATPAAGTAWIFCSDLVSVRLDEPNIYPTTIAEATDRGVFGQPNQVRIRAQRFAAVTFDVARLAACRVTLAS
jgi:hypothetical protein